MNTRVLAAVLIGVLLALAVTPLLTSAEIVPRDIYTLQYVEGLNSHLADITKYGEFVVLYELLKAFEITLTPGEEFSFTFDTTVPVAERYGKYSAGGQGSLTIRGKVVEDTFKIPKAEGTLHFVGDVVVFDGNLSQTVKEEIHIETTAQVEMALFNSEEHDQPITREVALIVGGLNAPAKTTSTRTKYYKDGRQSTAERPGSIFGTGFQFKYHVTAEHLSKTVAPPLDEEAIAFTGSIKDFAGRPMKYMEVAINAAQQTFTGVTDEDGGYTIVASGLKELPPNYCITTTLRYKKDGKERFAVAVHGGVQGSFYVQATKSIVVGARSDLHCDYVLSSAHPAESLKTIVREELLDTITAVYHHVTQAVEFYAEELKLDIPAVIVNCYDDTQGGTLYSPDKWIFVASSDMPTSSPHAPHNREWHEYNHHVMYSLYGQWPKGLAGGYEENHAGYVNDSTADSYVEGFAEFMALVIADYYDTGQGGIYAPLANMELYYKPWEYKGQAEELAVASLLWKLYTGTYGQEVGVTLAGLWEVLKQYSPDFYAVYEKLLAQFSANTGTIDALFIAHGFFENLQPGNGKYDALEPFIDQNKSRRYEAAEKFVDLPLNEQGKIEVRYESLAKVGYAAEPSRPNRRSPLSPLGHFVKTNNAVPLYTVDYLFAGSPQLNYSVTTTNKGGLVTVVVPPAEYEAKIIVKPLGVNSANPLTFTSADFYKGYDQYLAQGSFLEHDFKVTESVAVDDLSQGVIDPDYDAPVITTEGAVVTLAVPLAPSVSEATPSSIEPQLVDGPARRHSALLYAVPVVLGVLLGLVAVVKLKRK